MENCAEVDYEAKSGLNRNLMGLIIYVLGSVFPSLMETFTFSL